MSQVEDLKAVLVSLLQAKDQATSDASIRKLREILRGVAKDGSAFVLRFNDLYVIPIGDDLKVMSKHNLIEIDDPFVESG